MSPITDWDAWHRDYADSASMLSERLRVIQGHIRTWLNETAPRPVTAISACAGDGRDLLSVLQFRHDAKRVAATLIETDQRNAQRAVEHVRRLGLPQITIRTMDAGLGSTYAGAAPADLVLLCGIFGNINDEDVVLRRLMCDTRPSVDVRHRP